MISRIRAAIARVVGLVVFTLTLGRVEIDWTGSRASTGGAAPPGISAAASEDGATDPPVDAGERRPPSSPRRSE